MFNIGKKEKERKKEKVSYEDRFFKRIEIIISKIELKNINYNRGEKIWFYWKINDDSNTSNTIVLEKGTYSGFYIEFKSEKYTIPEKWLKTFRTIYDDTVEKKENERYIKGIEAVDEIDITISRKLKIDNT